jgi:hypothetical protein
MPRSDGLHLGDPTDAQLAQDGDPRPSLTGWEAPPTVSGAFRIDEWVV